MLALRQQKSLPWKIGTTKELIIGKIHNTCRRERRPTVLNFTLLSYKQIQWQNHFRFSSSDPLLNLKLFTEDLFRYDERNATLNSR